MTTRCHYMNRNISVSGKLSRCPDSNPGLRSELYNLRQYVTMKLVHLFHDNSSVYWNTEYWEEGRIINGHHSVSSAFHAEPPQLGLILVSHLKGFSVISSHWFPRKAGGFMKDERLKAVLKICNMIFVWWNGRIFFFLNTKGKWDLNSSDQRYIWSQGKHMLTETIILHKLVFSCLEMQMWWQLVLKQDYVTFERRKHKFFL